VTKRLAILGATGSIGRNALEIVRRFPGRFAAKVLTARRNTALLADQIGKYHPVLAAVYDADAARDLEKRLPPGSNVEVVYGEDGYLQAAAHAGVDTVLTAVVGAAGLKPTLAAIDACKDIALANKETLVMAGDIVMARAEEKGVRILPVDSEHSAIFQCLAAGRREDVDRIFLTASGGPFRTTPKERFDGIRPSDALKHPNWSMGDKITIDSATLMNKGLEVIEAVHLFGTSPDEITVVVHPESIVHSMVGFRDGSVMAQMGLPDMKGAIAYALSWPERLPVGMDRPDFFQLGRLNFEPPDYDRFPCLDLAFRACRAGGVMPAVLNGANEAAVAAFLNETIRFTDIPALIGQAMEAHPGVSDPELSDILSADEWARSFVQDRIADAPGSAI
jgi:1-deoxy-D-xylulose-5-phosphate reductoisomerase